MSWRETLCKRLVEQARLEEVTRYNVITRLLVFVELVTGSTALVSSNSMHS